METKQSIQMEIHDTIIHLCKEIQASGISDDTADMVKATAQLILAYREAAAETATPDEEDSVTLVTRALERPDDGKLHVTLA